MILGLWIIAQAASLAFVTHTLCVRRDYWHVWFAIGAVAFVPPLVSLGFWTEALPSAPFLVSRVVEFLGPIAVLAAILLAVLVPVRPPKWGSLFGRTACIVAAVLATFSSPVCRW